jgi:hypothetical protein
MFRLIIASHAQGSTKDLRMFSCRGGSSCLLSYSQLRFHLAQTRNATADCP